MAKASLFTPYLSELEAGLSNAKTDSAATRCNSGCTGTSKKGVTASDWHTNRGVTWCTFKDYASDHNIPQNQWCSLFIQMPDYIWVDIFKTRFWDAIKGDQIKSQAIAEYWANARWGNPSTANNILRDALDNAGINVKSSDTNKLVDIINDIVDNYPDKEFDVFASFVDTRVAWLKTLGSAKSNPGWFTRQEKLFDRGKAMILSKYDKNKAAKYALLGLVNRDYRTAVAEVPVTENKSIVGPMLVVAGAGLITGAIIAKILK